MLPLTVRDSPLRRPAGLRAAELGSGGVLPLAALGVAGKYGISAGCWRLPESAGRAALTRRGGVSHVTPSWALRCRKNGRDGRPAAGSFGIKTVSIPKRSLVHPVAA